MVYTKKFCSGQMSSFGPKNGAHLRKWRTSKLDMVKLSQATVNWILKQSGHNFFHDYYWVLKQSGHD